MTGARRRLDAALARYQAGEFAAAQADTQSVLTKLRAAVALSGLTSQAHGDLMAEATLLRLRCLARRERFDALIEGCSDLLGLLPTDQPSKARSTGMILLSYAELQVSDPEAALRAAFVALQDALAMEATSLIAQALDRLAMCYLWMGDAVAAERFMLESIGYAQQAGDNDTQLTRLSNALYMLCNISDAMADAGDGAGAAALIQRSRRLANLGQQLLTSSDNRYMTQMWRANQARWLRRSGQTAAARDLLDDVLAIAVAQGWHAIRRPLQLELADVLEGESRPQEAIAQLENMFEPAEARMRDQQAMQAHEHLERLYKQLDKPEPAALHRDNYQALLQRSLRAVAHSQAHLPELPAQIEGALADADRQRLQLELHRLREQHRAGEGLTVAGHEWRPAEQPQD